jgi:hypothetical protein
MLAFLVTAEAQILLAADPPSLIPYAATYNAISPAGNWLQAETGVPVSNNPNAPVQICAKFVYPSAQPGP